MKRLSTSGSCGLFAQPSDSQAIVDLLDVFIEQVYSVAWLFFGNDRVKSLKNVPKMIDKRSRSIRPFVRPATKDLYRWWVFRWHRTSFRFLSVSPPRFSVTRSHRTTAWGLISVDWMAEKFTIHWYRYIDADRYRGKHWSEDIPTAVSAPMADRSKTGDNW